MLKQPNFFHSQPSALPKDAPGEAPAHFHLSMSLGFSFISSVTPTRSSIYAYLITKIGNCNVNANIRELKQTDAAAVNRQISIQIQSDRCQGPTEFLGLESF